MNYLSVCSGIEAASVAWKNLGWKPVGFSEIESFPNAVLKHHYPKVINYGDINDHAKWELPTIDLLVGGTPCQSFSIAGLRKGLEDPRGNIMLTYLRILESRKPKWVVWENVPGVLSSNRGRDFGTFLTSLGNMGYGWCYRVLDAQWFGVAQRRRRVFVVGCFGDAVSAAKVLFESESVSRNPAPIREAGQKVAATLTGGFGERGVDADQIANGNYAVAACLRSGGNGGVPSSRGEHLGVSKTAVSITQVIPLNTMTIQGRPSDDLSPRMGSGIGKVGDPCPTLSKGHSHAVAIGTHCYNGAFPELSKCLITKTRLDAETETLLPIALAENTIQTPNCQVSGSLRANPGSGWRSDGTPVEPVVITPMAVRRLTPIECERLQGFPDNYTQIPYRNKLAENCPDGPRYKALGNSMAVPVMRWIGERIHKL